MNELLVTGPYPLVLAALSVLYSNGYTEIEHSTHDDMHLIFIHVDQDSMTFKQSTSHISTIKDTEFNFYLLPSDWNDFVANIEAFHQKSIDLSNKAEAEHVLQLSSSEHAINPFDPTGTVKDIDSATLDFLLACPKCGGYHSRHAGYFTTKSAYKNVEERGGSTFTTTVPVHICIKCKTPIASLGGVMYDVSKYVDLNAWEKTEKEAHAATGPGGQC